MDRLLGLLLRYLAGAVLGDAIMGDLIEHRRARGHLWFWRAAAGMLTATFAQRVGHATGAALHGVGQILSEPVREVRQASRALIRRPVYAASLVAVMALSLAIAVAVFVTVDGLLFRPLTYPRSDQLYVVQAVAGTTTRFAFPLEEIEQWRAAIPEATFAGFRTSEESLLEGVNEPGLGLASVDLRFFEVLGVTPRLGTLTSAHVGAPPSDFPVLIGDEIWARFGRDPGVVGRLIEIDPIRPIRFRIVGVMPSHFVFPSSIGAQVLSLAAPGSSLQVIARLPGPGEQERVRQRLEALMAASPRRANQPAPRALLTPLELHMSGGRLAGDRALPGVHVQTARLTFTAMTLLLLLACVNASALMAARAADRTREIVQRRALGARSSQIARSVMAEIAIIMIAGCTIGLVLTMVLVGVVARRVLETHALMTPEIGVRALAFAGLALGGCFVASVIWPVVRAIRVDWSRLGRDDTAHTTPPLSGRLAVIGIQAGLGVVLTICGLLAAGSVWQVGRNDPGFDDEHLGLIEARLSASPGANANLRLDGALAELLDRIRRSPHVVAAGAADTWVLSGAVANRMGKVNAIGAAPDSGRWIVPIPVTGGFFRAAGLKLVSGRWPIDAEMQPGGRFVIVSAVAAAAYWPGQSPLNKEVEINGRRYVVVGVVEDVRLRSWDESVDPAIYVPWEAADAPRPNPTIFVRTVASPGRVLNEIATTGVAGLSGVRVRRALPAKAVLLDSIRERRLRSWAFSTFAVGSLCILSVGVAGLAAISAGSRRRETGVRIALGATPRQVIGQLTRSQMAAIVAGVAVGLVLSLWAAEMMRASLYDLSPFEPALWVVAVIAVLTVGVLATIIPAYRAGRIDPVIVLRE